MISGIPGHPEPKTHDESGTINQPKSFCDEHGHARCYLFSEHVRKHVYALCSYVKVSVTTDGNFNLAYGSVNAIRLITTYSQQLSTIFKHGTWWLTTGGATVEASRPCSCTCS